MSDLVQRVREVLPSVRRDLESLVRIESVWADPERRIDVYRMRVLERAAVTEALLLDLLAPGVDMRKPRD